MKKSSLTSVSHMCLTHVQVPHRSVSHMCRCLTHPPLSLWKYPPISLFEYHPMSLWEYQSHTCVSHMCRCPIANKVEGLGYELGSLHTCSWLVSSLAAGTWLSFRVRVSNCRYKSYVGHVCGTWRIHMWDMTHSRVRHDSFICVTWFIHVCDMAHLPCARYEL